MKHIIYFFISRSDKQYETISLHSHS